MDLFPVIFLKISKISVRSVSQNGIFRFNTSNTNGRHRWNLCPVGRPLTDHG